MKKALFTECVFSDEQIEYLRNKGVEVKKAPGYLGEDKLIDKLRDCSIYVIGGADKASKKVIESTNLELIIFYGTGYESYVDIPMAKAKNIPVANTPKANAYTVSEHAVALILDAIKQITYLNNTTKKGEWIRRQTWNLQGKTLGIVGMGTIGGYVATIMYKGFGMKVLYVSREEKKNLEKEIGAKKVDMETLMKSSDVISVHASFNEGTVNIIGEKELSLVKPNAVLVCTSRAELVNPVALKKALVENKLSVAAFDSYYKEPSQTKDKDEWGLLSLPDNKFIITPHTAYSSQEAVDNMNEMVIENIISFLEKGKPTYAVN